MNIWNSKTYREDIFNVLPQLDTEALNEKSILITGASGLIGSAIVDLLIGYNLKKMAKITIYAAGRNPEKISHRFSHGLNAGLIPVAYDATQDIHFDFKVDYIIHGASKNPKVRTLHKIANTFNMTLSEFLDFPELNEYPLDDEDDEN